LTPLIILALPGGGWRPPFLIIGAVGAFWAILWFRNVRTDDLATPRPSAAPSLVNVLGVLLTLFAVDVLVHLPAAGVLPLPESASQALADRPWVPLASKAFMTVAGILTVFLWLWGVTRDDDGVPRGVFLRRFWVLAAMVVSINITWHFFRAWLPLFLQNQHHYTLEQTSWFGTAYYLSTDAGSIAA